MRQVSADELKSIRRDLGITDGAKVISIVARLRTEKGHRTLFKAAEIVAASLSEPIHIVVAGSGYEEEPLKEIARSLNEVQVHFVGHHEDIAPWFSVGDIVVMPSYTEPFGLVAAEAMSCEKPLIASGVDGLLEVIENGVSGILVPPNNERALSEALLKVFDSPELAEQLGNNARKRVRAKFSMETMVNGWIDCYRYVLNKPNY
jgi:glycosyltransferase involved in cell wall biosynthesis